MPRVLLILSYLDLFDEEVKLCSFYSYVLLVFLLTVWLQSFWVLRITYIYIFIYMYIFM